MRGRQPAWLANWRDRHRSPLSFWLHLVGIPLAAVGAGLALYQLWLWRWDLWWRPVSLLAASYALQYIGHRHEGNDMGEVVLVKRLLRLPYTAVSPRYRQH